MSTDDELREMERYLRKQYQRAGKEVLAKAEEYFKKFESLDKQKQKQVESGKLTEEEYKTWRRNKILYGEHWDKLMNQITGELYKTNQAAAAYVEGKSVKIFAENFNLVEKEIPDVPVKGYTFELVNEETVRQLATTGELMLPPPNPPDKHKDNQWNARQVHAEVLQGILQGDSMDKIALRLRNTVDKNEVSSIRNARTMVTAAENSGRQAGFDKAEKDGIIFKKEWIATVEYGRTRKSHLAMNGELVDNGELFSNGCEFPGDWRGDPSEVYNCRCTLGSKFIGFKKRQLEEAVKAQEEKQIEKNEKQSDTVISKQKEKIESANSVEEVQTVMKSKRWFTVFTNMQGIEVDTNDKIDLSGCDIQSAQAIYKAYDTVFSKYPNLIGKFRGITKDPSNQKSIASTVGSTVFYSTEWFSNYETSSKKYADGVKEKWYPQGTTFNSTIVHEIGHAIDNLLGESNNGKNPSKSIKSAVMKKSGITQGQIKSYISEYATKNEREFFAECFAEYMTSENPREVAKIFGEEIDKRISKIK